MRGKEWAVRISRNNVIGGPRVVEPRTFHADPTVLSGVADCLCSCLVVACVVWSFRFGMESVVGALAVWAASWVGGEFATVQTWSRDAHGVVCVLRYLR